MVRVKKMESVTSLAVIERIICQVVYLASFKALSQNSYALDGVVRFVIVSYRLLMRAKAIIILARFIVNLKTKFYLIK